MGDKYLTYEVADFAQDPDFIAWVKHRKGAQQDFWESWLARHPDKTQVVKEAEILVSMLAFRETPPTKEKIAEMWRNIDGAIDDTPVFSVSNRRSFLWWGGLAAAAAVALLLIFFRPAAETVIRTDKQEQFAQVLPDRSTVRLNADSRIAYRPADWEGQRSLDLSGEAFFAVEEGSTFQVKTDKGSVEVLGTRFNVNSRYDLEVLCFSGRVQVTSLQGEKVMLEKGQGVRFNPETERFSVDTTEAEAGWIRGNFAYTRQPLDQILEEIGRQFGVTLIWAPELGLDKELVSTTFTTDSLAGALYNACWPMRLEYAISGDTVRIFRP